MGEEYAVGNRLSLADFVIYNTFAEYLPQEQKKELPEWRRNTFGNFLLTVSHLQNYPKLGNIINNITEEKNVQRWLETRGVQKF